LRRRLWLLLALAPIAVLVARPAGEHRLAGYATPLEERSGSQRHNAELSLLQLQGAVIGPGEEFSFNQTVGSFSRDQGYRKAPVSYNGQLITTWGGGVCQTSTTLYNAALLAGMDITERHRHRFMPTYVPPGRDAAVAFTNIDLRFRNPHSFPVRIRGQIRDDRLEIGLYGSQPLRDRPEVVQAVEEFRSPGMYAIGHGRSFGRVRNEGKPGFRASVYRVTDAGRELISTDEYPPMHRIVDYRD
jgi:vancomycin resistance protein VanW